MPQGYNEEDFAEMQQQAIRRVREMQQRAKAFSEMDEKEQTEEEETVVSQSDAKSRAGEDLFFFGKKPSADEAMPKRESMQKNGQQKLSQQAQRIRQKQHEQKPQGMLSSLFHLDSDVSLILPILLLLGREGADDILLLALLYIMA